MNMAHGASIPQAILEVVSQRGSGQQVEKILESVCEKLGEARPNAALQKEILAHWQNMFTNGTLVWGVDLLNPNPPWFHIADRGKKTLENIDRDPVNPNGYMAHLQKSASLSPIAQSYISEALNTYAANCYKATAVMIGVCVEEIAIELAKAICDRLAILHRPPNSKLTDWRIKAILDEIESVLGVALDSEVKLKRQQTIVKLKEAFDYNWPSMTHMIRAARNNVGHPGSIDPVTWEDVHSSLLLFPHIARIAEQLTNWVSSANL